MKSILMSLAIFVSAITLYFFALAIPTAVIYWAVKLISGITINYYGIFLSLVALTQIQALINRK